MTSDDSNKKRKVEDSSAVVVDNYFLGQPVPPQLGQYIPVLNPATGETIATVASSTVEDIPAAIASARMSPRPMKPSNTPAVCRNWRPDAFSPSVVAMWSVGITVCHSGLWCPSCPLTFPSWCPVGHCPLHSSWAMPSF